MKLPFIDEQTKKSRINKFNLFMQWAQPTSETTILDVGITNSVWRYSNYLEMWYPYQDKITGLSLENAPVFSREFPKVKVVIGDGRCTKFQNDEFDVAFSNAVLEHVGSYQQQKSFVNEIIRVSKKAMITTPDRSFPIEFHTLLPVLHWFPRSIYAPMYRMTKNEIWSSEQYLNLLTFNQFKSLFPQNISVKFKRQRFLGLSSQLIAFVEK
jgi:Methyltransferase domain